MSDIFGNHSKSITSFEDPRWSQSVTLMAGTNVMKFPIVDISGKLGTNVQIDQSFTNEFFVTQYGYKLTPFVIRGVVPPKEDCLNDQTNNLNAVREFFTDYNASKNPLTLISVNVSTGFVFQGFLVAFSIESFKRSEGVDLVYFNFQIEGVISDTQKE